MSHRQMTFLFVPLVTLLTLLTISFAQQVFVQSKSSLHVIDIGRSIGQPTAAVTEISNSIGGSPFTLSPPTDDGFILSVSRQLIQRVNLATGAVQTIAQDRSSRDADNAFEFNGSIYWGRTNGQFYRIPNNSTSFGRDTDERAFVVRFELDQFLAVLRAPGKPGRFLIHGSGDLAMVDVSVFPPSLIYSRTAESCSVLAKTLNPNFNSSTKATGSFPDALEDIVIVAGLLPAEALCAAPFDGAGQAESTPAFNSTLYCANATMNLLLFDRQLLCCQAHDVGAKLSLVSLDGTVTPLGTTNVLERNHCAGYGNIAEKNRPIVGVPNSPSSQSSKITTVIGIGWIMRISILFLFA
jgi:hypothetical protein